jgi:predicted enzyme related to lactoylglutathione lyase
VPNPIVHFEIIGPDAKSLQEFYGQLFDWSIDANNEWQYGMVAPDGPNSIGGGIGPDMGGGNRVTIYAEVDELQPYLDKANSLGAQTLMPPTEVGSITMALLSDPAGNITGLVKRGNGAG